MIQKQVWTAPDTVEREMMTSLMTSSYHIVILIYRAIQRNLNQVWLVPRTVVRENVIYFPGFRLLEDRGTSQHRVTHRANDRPLVLALFITSYGALVLGALGYVLLRRSILSQNFSVLIPTLRKLCMGLYGLMRGAPLG